jgi:hypothetical protein
LLRSERNDASIERRLAFAFRSRFFFERLTSRKPLSGLALAGQWPVAWLPAHAARLGYDLLECVRMARLVPSIGSVDLAPFDIRRPIRQPPRFLSYWHEPERNSMVAIHVGVDLIRHRDKYYVVETNHGPSIYPRRRRLYSSSFDPIVADIMHTARSFGCGTVVPIALRWNSLYNDEFERAGREYGITVRPTDCPVVWPETRNRLLALPHPLAPETIYWIHGGLFTPVHAYVTNKWHLLTWLRDAIDHHLPSDSPLAMPRAHDRLSFPLVDHGPRWPNLVAKLATRERSTCVICGRFDSTAEARRAFGLNGARGIPRQLRRRYLEGLLVGRDRVIYQEYVPPEVDSEGRAQNIRLHMQVSPLRRAYMSAHLRISRRPVPDRVPSGIFGEDDAFIFNDCDYAPISPQMEAELRIVADHLGQAIHRAVTSTFETGAAVASS